MEKYTALDLKDQERIRDIVSQKLANAMVDIREITGYDTDLFFSILEDTVAKSVEIDLKLSLLARPHTVDDMKVRHYLKYNPHNVLDEPIIAFRYNHWFEIYNGVHRVEARRKRGDETVKATIITADKQSLEDRKLHE